MLHSLRAPEAVLRDAANSRPVQLDIVQAYLTFLQYMPYPNRSCDLCGTIVGEEVDIDASPDDRQLGNNGPDTGDGCCCHRSGSRISWWRDLSSRTSRTGGARTGSARTGIRRPSSGACDRAQSSCRAIRICAISAHDYCSAGRRILLAVCLAAPPLFAEPGYSPYTGPVYSEPAYASPAASAPAVS